MINFILGNWSVILFCIIIATGAYLTARKFLLLDKVEREKVITTILLELVTRAELEFGEGMGQVQRSAVYNYFKSKYPVLAMLINMETFDIMLDKSLELMKEILNG